MKYIIYLTTFLFFVLFEMSYEGIMTSFSQAQTTPSPTSANKSKAEAKISVEVIRSLGLEPYRYQHDSKNRDPFISLRQEVKKKGEEIINQTMLGPYLPLERFGVDQYQLMGIIWDTDDPRALIMDPNNQSHVIRKNDRIGLRKGYLAEIREGKIIIAEPVQQGLKVQYNIKTLTISKKASKKQVNNQKNIK